MIKVLIVGQTPPPYHGQAIMIDRLLRGATSRVKLFHVRMAFSESIGEVGKFRWTKLAHLVSVIVRIWYHRLVHGTRVLYYPPAGPHRIPLYRDLAILLSTRWMFRKTVLHFEAGGVSALYSQLSPPVRWLFRRALFHADAAVRLAECTPDDARLLEARSEYIIPNAVEDGLRIMEEAVAGGKVSSATARPLEHARGAHVERGLRLLFVGIMRESKGVLVLIEACGLLARRGVPFSVEFVGQFQSAEFEQRALARVAELGIEGNVTFSGLLVGQEKMAAFARADVLCLPSFYESEAFPIVLLEAMSFGLPVLATRWRGIPAIVDDGVTGYLVEPRDAGAVVDRLEQLSNDSGLRSRMGAAARDKYLGAYTEERYVAQFEAAFEEVACS